jgi:hypothetical protein
MPQSNLRLDVVWTQTPESGRGGELDGLLQAQEGSLLPGRERGEKGREGALLLREKEREEALLQVAKKSRA